MTGVRIVLDTRKLDELERGLPGKADQAIRELAFLVEANAKQSMAGGRGGRVYSRGRGRTHQASSLGEAPAVDTGALKNSIHVTKLGRGRYQVSDGVEYGVWLEFGSRKMAARPWLLPAVKRASQQLAGLVKRIVFP